MKAPLLAQPFPKDYFRNPLGIPIVLAGTFGELRSNHFHTGIDMKTNGEEGLPIYAAADGYVSRIGVSGGGYGNALYIDHPNGYTTVYGHLQRFNDSIQAYIKETQYLSESFEQNIFPPHDKFKVKKGSIVAYSGNTGGSSGAHLHFEIRETKSERPVNPMLFGLEIPDNRDPIVNAIKIYPMDSNSYVRLYYYGSSRTSYAKFGEEVKLHTAKKGEGYFLSGISRVEAYGTVGFSIAGKDYMDNTYNTMGLYEIELCINDVPHFIKRMDKLDFSMKKYINSHVDYEERMKHRNWYEKCYVSPHNHLPIYAKLENKGLIKLPAGDTVKVTYYIRDEHGNTSTLAFDVDIPAKPEDIAANTTKYDTLINFAKGGMIKKDGFYLHIPANALFENAGLNFSTGTAKTGTYSAVYDLGSQYIALAKNVEVGLKGDQVPEELRNKACIMSYMGGCIGGSWKNGYLVGSSRYLGKFYIDADDRAPVIQRLNIWEGANMSARSDIKLKITDNMSGINTYRGTIDGKWVLFQYDAKSHVISYDFDENCPAGKHQLTVEVTDYKENVATLTVNFTR